MGELDPICRRVCENLSAYLDGELKPGARRVIDEHLAQCTDCRRRLKDLKETWRMLDELEAPVVRRDLAEQVVQRARAEEQASRAVTLRRAVTGMAASAAAAVFLFGLYISSKPLSDVPTSAERECILYLDLLRDMDALQHAETIRYVGELGQSIGEPQTLSQEGDGSGV